MLQKLSFLIAIAIFLTACGASAPAREAVQDNGQQMICDTAESIAESAPLESASVESSDDPEPEIPCNAEYFIFTKSTNTITDADGQPLVYENQCLPQFSSMDPGRSEWVGGILSSIARDFAINSSNLRDYAEGFISMNGREYFYSHSNYQQLGIARHDDVIVSLISLSSLYAGGSHPSSVQTTYNLDVAGRRILRLEDVIAAGAAEELAALVLAAADEKFSPLELFDDYTDTIHNSMIYGNMTPYWYLNDTGLVIFYNQYELAPYAAGIIKLELPYEKLEGILLDVYKPIPAGTVPGNLVLRGNWSGYHSIPITINGEGERLQVGVEGKVYQVQISEVFWLDNTPISQELLFSARTLCQNDVLEITGGFDDENRSFAIEFLDGRGEPKIYYLHPGALSEEP